MKSLKTLIFLAFLCPLFSMAQASFQPGYIVMKNSDTIRGYVDVREWNSNPDAISFKRNQADKAERYTPETIKAFSGGVYNFITYSGPISTNVTDVNRIGSARDTSFRIAEVFLEVLQKGRNVILYSYADYLKTRYFIAETSVGTPVELKYGIYQATDENGTLRTKTDQTYLRQLNTLALKYGALDDELTTRLIKADYEKPALMQIVGKINKLSAQEYKAANAEGKAVYFYAGIAANFASTTHQVNTGYDRAGGKDASSVMPAFRAGFRVYLNPNTQRVELGVEIGAALSKYNVIYSQQITPKINVNYGYQTLTVSLTPLLIYNFYKSDALSVYAGGGAQVGNSSYSDKVYRNTADGSNAPTTANPFSFRTWRIPAVIKGGVVVGKKIDLNAAYIFQTPVSNDAVFILNTSSFQIGVNYRF